MGKMKEAYMEIMEAKGYVTGEENKITDRDIREYVERQTAMVYQENSHNCQKKSNPLSKIFNIFRRKSR